MILLFSYMESFLFYYILIYQVSYRRKKKQNLIQLIVTIVIT